MQSNRIKNEFVSLDLTNIKKDHGNGNINDTANLFIHKKKSTSLLVYLLHVGIPTGETDERLTLRRISAEYFLASG